MTTADHDYADLRRLAEAGIAGTVGRVTPETWQAILALLDERDHWKRSARHNYSASKVHVERAQAAERRVAALEDGLRDVRRAIESEIHPALPRNEVADARLRSILPVVDRALLAAAPSEPPDHEHDWERGAHMAEAFGVDGRVLACAICGAPKPVPAALTSASDEAEGLPAEVGLRDKSPTQQKLTELTRLSEDLPGGYAPSEPPTNDLQRGER